MKITHKKTNRYHLNIGHTTQFKTVKVQITFNQQLNETTVSKRALLPYILKATSQKYPRRKDLQTHLENLYSASFSAGVKKIGLSQELVFDLTLLDNRYTIDKDNLLEQGFELLHEIFFQPQFSFLIFEEEKRLLEEYFLGIYTNKMRYAMSKHHEAMYQEEAYVLQPLGTEDTLKTVTIDDVMDAYHSMMEDDIININIIGDVDIENILPLIDKFLPFTPRHGTIIGLDQSPKSQKQVQHLVETQDVQQAKFVLGYQFPIYYTEDAYYGAVVFNTLLGGSPESLLFKRIREDLNKVYFIGSSYDQYKGSLLIYGGINQEEYDGVVEEISAVIQSIMRGDYPKNRLDIAKKSLTSGLIESFDSPSSLASRVNHLSLFGRTFDPDELIAKIDEITTEDIKNVASKLRLDTTFLLQGDES